MVSKPLPLFVKRSFGAFLILLSGYFFTAATHADIPPDDVKNTIRTVIVDAGHGGRDPGALGANSKEKDITLKIALKLGKLIEENVPDVKVVYTRTEDVSVELIERPKIANENKADLYISIHVNASTKTAPYGTSTHIMGINQSGKNLDVAIRENSVMMLEDNYESNYKGFDPTSPESYLIYSLMQNTFEKQSIEFASYIQTEFSEKGKRKSRGIERQPLYVLANSSMPGVLIETGFITNLEEEKYLMSDYGQDIIASAIYRAFKQYKTRIESNSKFDVRPVEPEVVAEDDKANIDVPEANMPVDNVIKFYIQIASSRNNIGTEPSSFKGYTDVKIFEQGRWFKYTVGSGNTYHEAIEKCSDVKNDFPDAFVIAVKNGEIIPMNDALMEINN